MIVPDTDIKTVEKILELLGELPVAPVILNKALKLTSDLQSNINDISKNISADQTLTAKVIRMSNSPFYGRVNGISSLEEAIRVLGFNQIKTIVITASTQKLFQSGAQAEIADKLWQHSLATAIASRLIVKKFGILDKEEAYLCGLLHDIGKLVLLQSIPNVYQKIIEQAVETQTPFIIIEGKELGFNHVNVGQALLTKWQFPNHLISQISKHHSTKPNQKAPSMTLGRVVAIADSIAKYIGASFFEAYQFDIDGDIYLGDICINEDDLISLRSESEELFNYELNSIYE